MCEKKEGELGEEGRRGSSGRRQVDTRGPLACGPLRGCAHRHGGPAQVRAGRDQPNRAIGLPSVALLARNQYVRGLFVMVVTLQANSA